MNNKNKLFDTSMLILSQIYSKILISHQNATKVAESVAQAIVLEKNMKKIYTMKNWKNLKYVKIYDTKIKKNSKKWSVWLISYNKK